MNKFFQTREWEFENSSDIQNGNWYYESCCKNCLGLNWFYRGWKHVYEAMIPFKKGP
jgi:hypothetical protein